MKNALVRLALLLIGGGVLYSPASAFQYDEYPSIRLRSLDKITARTLTFDAQVGSTIKFGDIYIKIQSCRKPPPVEKNEAAAFLQIWQLDKAEQSSRWIFSGWMFGSSPALSSMDHPVYDVWVIDCLGKDPEAIPQTEPNQDKPLPDEGTVPDGSVAQPSVAPEEQPSTQNEAPDQSGTLLENQTQIPETTPEPTNEATNKPDPETPTDNLENESIEGIY